MSKFGLGVPVLFSATVERWR